MWSVAAVFLCCCVVLGQAHDCPKPADPPVEDTKVAFAASLGLRGNFGPFHTDVNLAFKNIFNNVGNAYNAGTGYFTAPVKGVYTFTFYGIHQTARVMRLRLMRNGVQVVNIYSREARGGHYSSATNIINLTLEKFDQVNIQLVRNTWIYDEIPNHYSTFTGHLLFRL